MATEADIRARTGGYLADHPELEPLFMLLHKGFKRAFFALARISLGQMAQEAVRSAAARLKPPENPVYGDSAKTEMPPFFSHKENHLHVAEAEDGLFVDTVFLGAQIRAFTHRDRVAIGGWSDKDGGPGRQGRRLMRRLPSQKAGPCLSSQTPSGLHFFSVLVPRDRLQACLTHLTKKIF